MGLMDRVKNILLTPKTEWEVIDVESTTVADLYKGYIMPLAAIGPVAQAIGFSIFGMPVPVLGTYRTPIGTAITQAVVTYILTLVAVYVLAIVIDALAPTFGGTQNRIQALKVAGYSYTASWVAGIFLLIPVLSFLSILGVYSLYLLF
nr:YIP1 family protein [Gemmatimonadales bacterium]